MNSREKTSKGVAGLFRVIQSCQDKVGMHSGSYQQCFSPFLIDNGPVLVQISVWEQILLIFRRFLPQRSALYQLAGLTVAVIELS